MTAKISSDHFTQKRHVELLSHHPQSYRPPRYTHTHTHTHTHTKLTDNT